MGNRTNLKSLAIKLHGDSISERETDTSKVRLLSYEGVAPARYALLFKTLPDGRKADGKLRLPAATDAKPRHEKSLEALPTLEAMVVQSLVDRSLIQHRGGHDDENGPYAA